MKFSIIIPVYNVEKYLSECVNSILGQSFSDFEVILVDDGSTDGSGDICERYASGDSRIKVIHQPNGGQARARNAGLGEASGDYVFFIDSDDFLIDSQVLEKIDSALAESPDIVHFKFVEWRESEGRMLPCRFSYDVETEGKNLAEIYCALIDQDAYYNSAWSKCIRRSLLVEKGIAFEPGISGEDNEWYYHVVLAAEHLILIDDPLYVYRRRSGSITTTITEKNLKDQIYVLNKWEALIKEDPENPKCEVVRGSLAKQYCSALILYARLQGATDVSSYGEEIVRLSYLLQFSRNPRVRVFRRLCAFLGVRGMRKALSLYIRLIKR